MMRGDVYLYFILQQRSARTAVCTWDATKWFHTQLNEVTNLYLLGKRTRGLRGQRKLGMDSRVSVWRWVAQTQKGEACDQLFTSLGRGKCQQTLHMLRPGQTQTRQVCQTASSSGAGKNPSLLFDRWKMSLWCEAPFTFSADSHV